MGYLQQSPLVRVSDDVLMEPLRRFRDERGWTDVVDNSLDKDVRCILRMYGSVTQGRDLLEDSVDSLFAELGLIRPVPGDAREWSINVGPKRELPDDIVAYACLDYAQSMAITSKMPGVAGLARNEGSPGRAFALTEIALDDALTCYSEREDAPIEMAHAAGNRQLVVPAALEEIGEAILGCYYRRRRGKGRRP